jgi:hypothetical protein
MRDEDEGRRIEKGVVIIYDGSDGDDDARGRRYSCGIDGEFSYERVA